MNRRIRTDDNELSGAFKKVEPALLDLREKPFASDLAFHPRYGASHDTALGHGFCRKNLFDPVIGNVTFNALHAPSWRAQG